MDQNVNKVTGEFLTVSEVAEFLRIGKTTVYELCKYNPSFPAVRIGRQLRVFKSELIEWLKVHRHTA
jgi:excisionase family DNA binding protein